MRNHFIEQPYSKMALPDPDWLPIRRLADVEVTSEDPARPIENVFLRDQSFGWRARGPGQQFIRLRFNRPLTIKRIRLRFAESVSQRTQEYSLRWSSNEPSSPRHIVRQQWNFSPPCATSQIEDHYVELAAAVMLELNIIPDIRGSSATASLLQWWIG